MPRNTLKLNLWQKKHCLVMRVHLVLNYPVVAALGTLLDKLLETTQLREIPVEVK